MVVDSSLMNFNKADAMLVMGRGIRPDGTLPQGTRLRGKLALDLFTKKLAPMIILTSKGWGFQNFKTPITAAESMKRFIIKLGAPEKIILKEETSEDTIGEAYFAKVNLIDKHNWKKLIIVTSSDHLERTKFIFRHVFGPAYDLQFAAADHGLSPRALNKSIKLEKKSFKFARKYLRKITPGNTAQVKKMIHTKHIMYNGSILKPILKKILGKPPYNN